ncbi:MAG: pilus assembly protein [Candidatus Schekmanbacteria bacterium RBG_13_48_7]|uniref:Pilus assembly protein n=1 Tax=Candidatus Schekmanbacteria bacterium RBG_13_48_7 TaxID=1817878 RepID=A0A1F7RYX5_9BACT|nr:MAG: pilus assembly protein [Candidatus Schekmanbacteria bacterium RBG_13_48_7]
MRRRVLIDSGPLIALFDKDDRYHQQAINFIRKFEGELITNYAVITEVTHLLDFSVRVQIDFLHWILSGGITPVDVLNEDLNRIVELTGKYLDLPMDFADASLIVLSERMKIKEVASIDKDFGIYRTRDKQRFHNVFLS